MPVITLTWNAGIFTPQDATPYVNHGHIYALQLRDGNNNLISNGPGLYIIENNANVIYAGESSNIRNRFNNRGDTLREFGLQPTVALANHTVRYATTNPVGRRELAETWLIRILYLRDQALAQQFLQNVEKTGSFNAPGDGLTINNVGTRPAYLNAQYVYNAGAQI
ncbi:hypothetical protein COCOR_06840 [Corallococcus coralloides DSM 2259]|uniref:GIY-YIG domain-containing protein n=1 Tax=Corallococcus coralloides (strain ATCC 25202 / DSM 2259 / NBRC 100086 / M2) TaxID=1144275 RepID=H8N0Y5_CORCM|nr:GIY-YIG nuclease family protein [Corallococcus coralloides]AFE07160.1 hypothetical protein COCOR_06840 [Corallococcus coralloides DSM 2259]